MRGDDNKQVPVVPAIPLGWEGQAPGQGGWAGSIFPITGNLQSCSALSQMMSQTWELTLRYL